MTGMTAWRNSYNNEVQRVPNKRMDYSQGSKMIARNDRQ